MLVRFHDDADAEAQAIHDLYADIRKGAEFEAELMQVIDTIERFPESGHPYIRGTRRKLIRGFQCSVIYKIMPNYAVILAVAHFKQEWGYWLERLDSLDT